MKRFVLIWVFVGALVAGTCQASAQANDRKHDDVHSLEDLACLEVNRAYESMNNSGRWSTDLFWLYPNGNTHLYLRTIYFDRRRFNQRDDGGWANLKRPVRLTVDVALKRPILSARRFEGVQTINGEPTHFFRADWQMANETASKKIWISMSSGKFVKTIRHYVKRPDWADSANLVQVMDYDRDHIVEPWGR